MADSIMSIDRLAREQAMALADLARQSPGYRVPRQLHGVVRGFTDGGVDVDIEGSTKTVKALKVRAGYAGGRWPALGETVILHAHEFDTVVIDVLQ